MCIYRDLKASNILLDSELNARLSDFVLARNGHLTMNNDVYSFSVVLLELLSGRRAIADERGVEETLVEWVKPFLCDNRGVFRIMDTRLGGWYSKKGAQAVATLALKCLHKDPKQRRTMSEVVVSLEEITNTSRHVHDVSSQVDTVAFDNIESTCIIHDVLMLPYATVVYESLCLNSDMLEDVSRKTQY
ncbi:probable serine/threonine-protein kinase PBL3 isoform X1 [Tanacetum coccineum]